MVTWAARTALELDGSVGEPPSMARVVTPLPPPLVLGTKRKTRVWAATGDGDPKLGLGGADATSASPAEVLTPKLPFQVPKTLMKSTPNQLARVRWLFSILRRFTAVLASPV